MTLTQTAILVKQIITISIIALVLGLISFIGYKVWYAYYLARLPSVAVKPDNKFGLLPALNFLKSTVSTSNFSYSLDTVTGGLPKVGVDQGFESIIKVYFVTQTFATFLSSERSTNLAEKFNITAPPEILSETKYKFSNSGRTLLVNLDTGNFSYTKEASISGKINVDESRLVSGFKQTLSALGAFKNDLQNGKDKITFLKSDGKDFIITANKEEANAVLISIWPAAIDNKPILTADSNRSLIYAITLGESNDLDNYYSLNFTYYPIDTSIFATYQTKTAETAFEDLKNNKGIVIVQPDKPQVSITSLSLGYYLEENYSPYLQPIFIFEGPNFIAYVPAISNQP